MDIGFSNEITLSAEEYKEFLELKKERDKMLITMRSQMKLQQKQAQALAAEVIKALEKAEVPTANVSLKNADAAANAYALARDILA